MYFWLAYTAVFCTMLIIKFSIELNISWLVFLKTTTMSIFAQFCVSLNETNGNWGLFTTKV